MEDEIHFTCDCSSNNAFKKPLIATLGSLCNNFKNLCNKDKFILLLSKECDYGIYFFFANYIIALFNREKPCVQLNETLID